MFATSSTVANRFNSELGRAVWKNSASTTERSTPRCLARSATKVATPSDSVGPGSTELTVMPVPATDSEGVATFVADLARQRGVDRSVVEAEFFQTARPSSLIKRFATVDEVANMIIYVCSPLASATNGAALRVDGGVVRAIV